MYQQGPGGSDVQSVWSGGGLKPCPGSGGGSGVLQSSTAGSHGEKESSFTFPKWERFFIGSDANMETETGAAMTSAPAGNLSTITN
jgi:hypothetical protein